MPITRYEPDYDLQEERLERLRTLFPEAFADGELDWDALRDLLGAPLEEGDEYNTYGLFWPGKRAARRAAALPPRDALAPAPGEGVDEETTRNVFIEGDNLEVLKLLRKAYAGRVKIIYIDPPYNRGNDFVYRDDFSEPEDAYLIRTSQMNDLHLRLTSNPITNGRFHSTWLDMMYPRIALAAALLCHGGALFVSIDDTEVANLLALLDEVFGQGNVETLVWKTVDEGRYGKMKQTDSFRSDHQFVAAAYIGERSLNKALVKPEFRSKPKKDEKGEFWTGYIARGERGSNPAHRNYYTVTSPDGVAFTAQFEVSREEFASLDKAGYVYWTASGIPYRKIYRHELREVTPSSVLDSFGTSYTGKQDLLALFDELPFDNPKPVSMIKHLVQVASDPSSVVIDFFAGSCTTAQAVLELNRADGGERSCVMVQLPEPTPAESTAYSAGLWTVAEIGKERIRRVIARMKAKGVNPERETPEDLGFRVFKQVPSNYRRWRDYEGQSVSEYQSQLAGFTSPLVEGWDPIALRTEVMLAQGFPLDSRIARCDALPHNAVDVISHEWCEHRLWVCLDECLAPETVHALSTSAGGYEPEDVFVCLDSALSDEARARLDDRCHVVII